MYPILLQFGPLTLRTYGALIALGFLAAMRMAKRAAQQRGIPEKFIMDISVLLVLSGIVGARLFYVAINGPYYISHIADAFKVWEGGLVFYGGFLVAAAMGVVYARRHRVSVGVLADCLSPALAMGQAIGRWGCFFAGCCYGKPTNFPLGVKFFDPASLAPLNVSLHPTQIYEALGSLAISLWLWRRLVRRPNDTPGNVFWMYVLCYGFLRLGVEMLRGDNRGPTLAGLFPSQIIAIIAILVAGSLLIAHAASPSESHGTSVENHK
jgi:phosphatidylglycerol---prolipoprotein diacylglyceryl transferase